ncbi:MAG: sulfur carrier protein ThiS [Burkholderiaceae bacterium]
MTNSHNLSITVNGKPETVLAGTTMAQLLDQLELTGKRIAVERNGEIVPKSQYRHAAINSNDAIEIVVAVGGG